MPAPKGHPKYGGRQKGTPNKKTKELKDMILTALSGVGGVAYLKTQAKENPAAFMTLVGKVLPMTVQGPNGGSVPMQITIVTGVPRADD